jgi:outer membrane protein TolC
MPLWVAAAAAAAEPAAMTLDEALAALRTDAPGLAQARARADAARGVARQAAAAWLPVLVATGTYLRNDDEVVLSFGDLLGQLPLPVPVDAPDDVTIQPLEVWNGALTARVPLVAAPAWSDGRAAARAVAAADATLEEVGLELEAAVVAAAAGVEGADGVVAAAERAVGVAEAHLRATRVAVEAGTATRVDQLAAEAEVARRKSEAVAARARRDAALDAAGVLLGVDGPVRIALPEGPAPETPPGPRPAIAAAEAQVDAARARVSSAWLRHLPTVSATGLAQAATVPYPTGNDSQWRVGLEATWTAYDGGLRYGRLDQARAELDGAEAALRAERLRASKELRDAERDLAVAQEQVTLAEEQAALAAEAAAVAERGLAAGTTSALLARDVEQQAFAAEVGVAGARARLRIAEAQWRRAGGLGQRW